MSTLKLVGMIKVAKKGDLPLPADTANTQAGKNWVVPMTTDVLAYPCLENRQVGI